MSQSIFPIFKTQAVEVKAKSAEEGRPIFEDREFVEIHIAGDNKSIVVHPVRDEHKERWPEQYKAFKEGKEAPMEGTPLAEWPILTASKVAELHSMKIKTVEQLAEIKDSTINRLGMGARELVKQAQAFLDVSADVAAAQKYAAANEQLENEVAMLKQQIKELSDQITDQKKSKKGEGVAA